MSIQNGRPGNTVNSTGPIVGYGKGGGMAQHPLASPKTQHINMPSSAPTAPGSHTLVPAFQQRQAVTNLGQPPRTVQKG